MRINSINNRVITVAVASRVAAVVAVDAIRNGITSCLRLYWHTCQHAKRWTKTSTFKRTQPCSLQLCTGLGLSGLEMPMPRWMRSYEIGSRGSLPRS